MSQRLPGRLQKHTDVGRQDGNPLRGAVRLPPESEIHEATARG